MRWGKALTTLIIIFMILNSALAIGNYAKNIQAYKLTNQRVKNITKILKDKEITIEADLPDTFLPQQAIWIVPVDITAEIRDRLVKDVLSGDTNQITLTKEKSDRPYENPSRIYTKDKESLSFQDNNITYENKGALPKEKDAIERIPKDQALGLAKAFVQKINLADNFKDVKIDYTEESYGANVIYYELHKGKPIFDSYINIKISPRGVFKAYIHALNIDETKSSKKPIQPIDKVLFTLQDEIKDKIPLTISSIELGYAMESSRGMHILKEEAIPMYKILLDGLDDPVFVNAYTNTVEHSTSEK